MRFDELIGQEKSVRLLKASMAHGRVAHAYLFAGPDGSGKLSLASAFAAALNCQDHDAEGRDWEPCGECAACLKTVHGNHPDLRFIVPDGARLKIEQMRELQRENTLRPYEGRYKIFVIDGAETMTPEAANSLLKVLEEPPGPSVFLLLTSSLAKMLPTVISRCITVKMMPVSAARIVAQLEADGVAPETAAVAAELADGALGQARELVAGYPELKKEAMGFCAELADGNIPALLTRAAGFDKDRAEAGAWLNFLSGLYREAIFAAAGASSAPLVAATGLPPLTLEMARSALAAVIWTARAIKANAAVRLALEVLFLHLVRCHRGAPGFTLYTEEFA